jgi:hypothetical protein
VTDGEHREWARAGLLGTLRTGTIRRSQEFGSLLAHCLCNEQ